MDKVPSHPEAKVMQCVCVLPRMKRNLSLSLHNKVLGDALERTYAPMYCIPTLGMHRKNVFLSSIVQQSRNTGWKFPFLPFVESFKMNILLLLVALVFNCVPHHACIAWMFRNKLWAVVSQPNDRLIDAYTPSVWRAFRVPWRVN